MLKTNRLLIQYTIVRLVLISLNHCVQAAITDRLSKNQVEEEEEENE